MLSVVVLRGSLTGGEVAPSLFIRATVTDGASTVVETESKKFPPGGSPDLSFQLPAEGLTPAYEAVFEVWVAETDRQQRMGSKEVAIADLVALEGGVRTMHLPPARLEFEVAVGGGFEPLPSSAAPIDDLHASVEDVPVFAEDSVASVLGKGEAEEDVAATPALVRALNRRACQAIASQDFAGAQEALDSARVELDNYTEDEPPYTSRMELFALTLNNFACMFNRQDRPQAARVYLERAVAVETTLTQHHGIHTPNAVETKLNLGCVLSKLGIHDRALKVAMSTVRLLRRRRLEHPTAFNPGSLAVAFHNAGVEQEIVGAVRDALESFEAAARTAEDALGPDHGLVLHLQAVLARARGMQAPRRGGKEPPSTPAAVSRTEEPLAMTPAPVTDTRFPALSPPGTPAGRRAADTTPLRVVVKPPPFASPHSWRAHMQKALDTDGPEGGKASSSHLRRSPPSKPKLSAATVEALAGGVSPVRGSQPAGKSRRAFHASFKHTRPTLPLTSPTRR